MQRTGSPTHFITLFGVADKIPNGPTRPQVPIPADTPVHSNRNTMVDKGPQIAEARVGAIQILGLRQMFPI